MSEENFNIPMAYIFMQKIKSVLRISKFHLKKSN